MTLLRSSNKKKNGFMRNVNNILNMQAVFLEMSTALIMNN